jgi:hypothetical protein
LEDEARQRADRKTALLGAFEGNKPGQPASRKRNGKPIPFLCPYSATRSVPSKAASSGSLGSARAARLLD